MSATTYIHGHAAYFDLHQKAWLLKSTGKPYDASLPCVRCGKSPVNGMDACIASLKGVEAACCGHGRDEDGYIIRDGVKCAVPFYSLTKSPEPSMDSLSYLPAILCEPQ